jgi:hypothetical protein
MYYHNSIGLYHNITLYPVRVLTRIAAYCSTVNDGIWHDETLVKCPSTFHTASYILLGVTVCLSFSWLPFIAVFVESKS